MTPDRPASDGGPVSSILEKIAPGLRADIDRAIIERDPPTIRDVMIRFQVRRHGVSKSAFYRYAAHLRFHADLERSARLARADGHDPFDAISTILDAEFARHFSAQAPAGDESSDDDPSDPFELNDATFDRLQRIVTMRQRLAVARILSERAATLREDAEFRRNNTQTREIAAALRAYASAALDRAERTLGTRATAPVSDRAAADAVDPKGGV